MAAQDADCVVGFTGTREGMTEAQKSTISAMLGEPRITWVHHGDCVGADAEFHKLAKDWDLWVTVHPPSDDRLRAFCQGNWVMAPLPYLDRNRNIVDASTILFAAPKETMEARKGGTWYTVRYARKIGREVMIVWPDGTTQSDGTVAPATPHKTSKEQP